MRKGKDPDPHSDEWIRIWIREAQKHADPADPDPDPQRRFKHYQRFTVCSVPSPPPLSTPSAATRRIAEGLHEYP